ncbi:hypothetical protein BS47DRAFT_67075 [Hydnum rufescens UP504]|uniref:F-box domain-containing protein n=1 Tax=Hydnum rufescens UP504 TaxID=1448309 RepID=A0A9P6AR81_9AGAM|nr:hypothetical protein BS47DRAFT_67075 [Hydnum rufescens UP504]
MESHLNLSTIPTDVIELIAYHAVMNDFLGPPRALVALISTCRSLYYSLSLENNPSLHAAIFRFKFDSAAAHRRFGRSEPWRISATGLSAELRARFDALRYMRGVALSGNRSKHPDEEIVRHLWTLYFMCIESDEKNVDQLLFYGKLRPYIQICLTQYLLPVYRAGGGLPETVDRSLILWMSWFSTTWDSLNEESADLEAEITSLLCYVVYANFNFNAYFAPWMIPQLPIKQRQPNDRNSHGTSNHHTPNRNRYSAVVDPVDRSITINLYGRPLHLTPPVLVHAAMLLYFARLERRSVSDITERITPTGSHIPLLPRSVYLTMRLADMRDSKLYDTDFDRFRVCQDPYSSPGIGDILEPGMFSGEWEGHFFFIDSDSFRDMLDGDDMAIHMAMIARQPQVWNIKEHHYQPHVIAPLHDSTSQRRTETSLRRTLRPMPSGPSLSAHLPRNLELIECIPAVSASKPPSLISSSSSSVIFENLNPHSHIGPMLHATYTTPTRRTRVRTTYTTWTAESTPYLSPKTATENDSQRQSHFDRLGDGGNHSMLRAMPSTNSCLLLEPSLELDPSEQELAECTGLKDMILTGKGHSARGPFILKGRVRLWDGMVNLVKTYTLDNGQGTQLYRGYILSNGLWIGRWRDTVTEEDTNGFEGLFAMTRRSKPFA